MKKKIGLILNFGSSAGGIYQYALTLLDGLYLSNYQVIIFYNKKFWNKNLKPYAKKFILKELRGPHFIDYLSKFLLISHLPLKIIRLIHKYINPSFSLIKKEKCDLLIYPYPDLLSYQLGSEFIVAIHDLMHLYEPRFPELSGFFKKSIRELRFKAISNNAKGILVDSYVGKNHVKLAYKNSSKNIYILPFVPPQYIQKVSFVKPPSLKDLNLPSKFMFYPAKFWAHKNHINLIRAAHIVKKYYSDIHFVFTGNRGKEYNKIVSEIKLLKLENTVTILEEIDLIYIPFIYKNATALIMPSFGGPTNIPPLEAIFSSCAVGVSRIYGMPEQLQDASLYFDPNSVNEIADVIKILWNNEQKRSELIRNGDRLKEKYTIKSHKERLIKILDSL